MRGTLSLLSNRLSSSSLRTVSCASCNAFRRETPLLLATRRIEWVARLPSGQNIREQMCDVDSGLCTGPRSRGPKKSPKYRYGIKLCLRAKKAILEKPVSNLPDFRRKELCRSIGRVVRAIRMHAKARMLHCTMPAGGARVKLLKYKTTNARRSRHSLLVIGLSLHSFRIKNNDGAGPPRWLESDPSPRARRTTCPPYQGRPATALPPQRRTLLSNRLSSSSLRKLCNATVPARNPITIGDGGRRMGLQDYRPDSTGADVRCGLGT